MRTLLSLIACAAVGAALISSVPAHAASPMPMAPSKATSSPTPAPPASATEKQFVDSVSKDLQSRFATTDAATAAGYFRYTDEDDTGAISWVNTKYWTSDPQHPSQLWYDVKGRLIGADFSVPESSSTKPSLWGVSPSRWTEFEAHVHFGIKTPSGTAFGGAGPKGMASVGGSLTNPTAQDVVKLGKTSRWKQLQIPAPQSTSDVAFVFPFPAIWDLEVWLVPNPLGAFADHNPNVIPSANAKAQD